MAKPSPPPNLDWEWHMRAARRHLQENRPDAALDSLAECGRLRPGHIPTQIARAGALFRCGDHATALKQFTRIISIEPCNVAAHHGAGLALHAVGDRTGALAAFRCAVSLDPTAWESWQSIADITPDEAERLDAVQAAANALRTLCERGALSQHILRQAASALVCAGQGQASVHLLQSGLSCFQDQTLAHALIAGAHYSLGQFEAAARHQAHALPRSSGQAAAGAPSFEPGRALAALIMLTRRLEAGGFRPFLAAGTLLGFVRSGGPLAHDRDIDIGLMRAGDGAGDPVDFIRAHPGLLLPRSVRPSDRYVGLTLDGIAADIFVFDTTPDGLVCGFSDLPGDIQWQHAPFRLKARRFGDHTFRIPDPAATYLAECYGPDWQMPDPGFASALRSPALHKTSAYAIAFTALARARKCLLAGNARKASALLCQIPPAAMPKSLSTDLSNDLAAYRSAHRTMPGGSRQL